MKFRPQILFLALLVLSCAAANCAPDTDPELEKKYKIGGLYSIVSGEPEEINIVKVIAITKGIVHVRQYKNTYPSRPVSIDSATLSLGSNEDPEGFGIRHLPADKETFEKMQPVFIKQENVTDEELQGFKDWKANK